MMKRIKPPRDAMIWILLGLGLLATFVTARAIASYLAGGIIYDAQIEAMFMQEAEAKAHQEMALELAEDHYYDVLKIALVVFLIFFEGLILFFWSRSWYKPKRVKWLFLLVLVPIFAALFHLIGNLLTFKLDQYFLTEFGVLYSYKAHKTYLLSFLIRILALGLSWIPAVIIARKVSTWYQIKTRERREMLKEQIA